MVYCGVPSKACGACRAKRTRCDQATPSCGQCRRARRDCPGYRDAHDLVFRNETKHVVSKAQGSKTLATRVSSRAPAPLTDSSGNSDTESDFNALILMDSNSLMIDVLPAAYDVSPPRRMAMSIEDQASSFFFHHFVIAGSTSPSSYSNYLPHMYNFKYPSGSAPNPLPGIITAIGMAGLSNMQSSPSHTVVVGTRQKYTSVLRALNLALHDPRTASANPTLMAVMLLGLYETITCTTPQSLRSWANHINGATAIALVRGEKQVETEIGRHIFAILRNQIMIDCLQRRRAVPPEIMEWADLATQYDGRIIVVRENQLFQIIARLCALRSVYEPNGEVHDPVFHTLAKQSDSDLADYVHAFPSSLQYTTKHCNFNDSVLFDYYHVYPNTLVIGAYNLYRVARILANEMILSWLRRNPEWDNAHIQRRQSERILARMNADICASVPFALGEIEGGESLPRASVGIGLVWPLYLAATMDGAQESTRAWVITRLDKLGHELGIQQAVSLANVLKTKHEITAWDRFESTRMDEEFSEW